MTPSKLQSAVHDAIRDLIEINKDSHAGFEHAADLVEEVTLSSRFRETAAVRAEHAEALAAVLPDASAEPDGSALASAHRWWISLRAKLSLDETRALLEEVERGEDVIKRRYETVLDQLEPSKLRTLLEGQYTEVVANHDRYRQLRDARR